MNLQPNNGKKIEKIGTVGIGKRKLMMDQQQEPNSAGKKRPKSSIFHRGLPAELLNELFAALPLENAFTLLTKMPNVLLARNIQKMTNTKKSMTANKLNSSNCGRKLIVLEEGIVKHSGSYGSNSIRAIFPLASFNLGNKGPTIAFYFEVKILKKATGNGFGFCGKNFPLDSEIKCLGREKSTIGIWTKAGILIDGSFAKFEKNGGDFKQADIIGLGIIHCPANSPMKCFATCNGELLGKANLPSTFSKLQLYPALTLVSKSTSMLVNFGKEKWHFKQFKMALE